MSFENPISVAAPAQVQASLLDVRNPSKKSRAASAAKRSDEGASIAGDDASTPPGKAHAISNTWASTSQKPVTGDLDWLDVGIYGHWERGKFPQLRERLELARGSAEVEGPEDASCFELEEGDWLKARPSGAKRGIYYRYVCETMHGFTFYIRDLEAFDERHASVYVQIGSLPLMMFGHRRAWEMAKEVLKSMGFVMHFNIVSRADLCVDLPGQATHPIVEQIMQGACIRRARCWNNFGEGYEYTGFVLGKDIRMRIYNKLLEVKHDPLKLAVMVEKRWGGSVPDHATRCEFQLRREQLKERWGVTTVDNLFGKLVYIVADLCGNWFRMTDRPVSQADRENNNHQRYEISEFWRRVFDGFLSWMTAPEEPFIVEKKPKPDAKQIKRQALGCLQKYAVLMGIAIEEVGDTWKFFKRLFTEEGADFVEGVRQKRLDMSFRVPSKLLITEAMIPF